MATQAAATQAPLPVGEMPSFVTGTFKYSNSIITDYYVEQAVALVDMYGFVTRDQEWEIPVEAQVLGYLKLDTDKMEGTYSVQLPAKPMGQAADVDNNGQKDAGVQVFVVSYWPNLTGGPYSEGDDPSRGWPSYLTTAKTDSENKDEVIGGALIVWAPDGKQEFPTGFGADGLLFTEDDPVGPIPAGYSVVNLDSDPFTVSQEPQSDLTLYEPKDVAIKNFADLSYTDAFDQMFEIIRKEYAFNGIEGKEPDWDSLYAELKPRVEQAEKDKDANAYYLALRDFTRAFKDGHVGLGGGDYADQDFTQSTAGGYGFAIRELDDGRFLVMYVLEDGPAAKAGIKVGDEITEFNGEPIGDAIAKVQIFSTQSSDFAIRYQQARYLLRAEVGVDAKVTFTDSTGKLKTASLTSVEERDSFSRTSIYYGVDTSSLLPVDFKILDSGVGYIRINSNYDDLNLIIRLFERALKTFEAYQLPGIIIDMRYNSGGANLGLAGFLTDQEIPMGQLAYYSDKTGKFEPEGQREMVLPNQTQYHFDKMVLLVGMACYSACELESYGFSQVPGMIVVGQYPTAGVEAEVARGQFELPEGFSLQVPTGRFTLPDGSLFLEGQGVPPTQRVPVDETTIFSTDDIVLKAAEDAILQSPTTGEAVPQIAEVVPAGPPTLLSQDKTEAIISTTSLLEDKASESYSSDQLLKMDTTFTYTISLAKSEPLLWVWGWCAKNKTTLTDNLSKIDLGFTLNGKDVPIDTFLLLPYDSRDGQSCQAYLLGLDNWPSGTHHVTTTVTFTAALNDGTYDFTAGKQVFEYIVDVKP
jgi:C-terminal processing protease CtpA/Prc